MRIARINTKTQRFYGDFEGAVEKNRNEQGPAGSGTGRNAGGLYGCKTMGSNSRRQIDIDIYEYGFAYEVWKSATSATALGVNDLNLNKSATNPHRVATFWRV
jgi:hypothetical protein